jgi:hypothetical protein
LYLLPDYSISIEYSSDYLVAITDFESQDIRDFYISLLNNETYNLIDLDSVVNDFVTNTTSELVIHYKCATIVFDNFDNCAVIKHIY